MSEITQIKGTVHEVLEIETFASGFQKQSLIVKTGDEKYPQFVNIEFTKDKIELLNGLNVGEEITVNYNLNGRAWLDPKTETNKYFNSCVGWKLEKTSTEPF